VTAQPTDADWQAARELALLARSGVGGPPVRLGAIAQALADARAEGVAHAARLVQNEADARGRHTSSLDQIAAGALDSVAGMLRKESAR
jgi:hypothetical protein